MPEAVPDMVPKMNIMNDDKDLVMKRKLEGKEPLPGKGKKGGKLKKGEKEYKSKIDMNRDDEDAEGNVTDKVRRT